MNLMNANALGKLRVCFCRVDRHHQLCCRRTLAIDCNPLLVEPTRRWLERIVIGEKLCPFAPPLLRKPNLLRIVSSTADDTSVTVQDVAAEANMLVRGSQKTSDQHETTLIVLRNHDKIKQFRDFVRLSWEIQEAIVDGGLSNDVQIVLFHPLATHQTYAESPSATTEERAGDYTIRSPFPTIHLLREVDVLRAASSYPDLESLPARNQRCLLDRGLKHCQDQLSLFIGVSESDANGRRV